MVPAVLHARLLAAPRSTTGPHADLHTGTTTALVAVLRVVTAQIRVLAASIGDQPATHPNAAIFTSLPGCPAARLLAEIGDARGRFPTRDSLTCLAGVAPSTRQSGKGQGRYLPPGRRQAAARPPGRLRRRLPPGQPLGRRPVRRGHCPRPRPPPRRPHPGPRLGTRNLALLAGQ